MTPFEAYQLFLAVKMHFTQPSYDMVKYNGKVNANFNSFCKRRDKYQFAKLARHKDPQNFLIANFIDGNNKWVGELFTDDSEHNYVEWLKRQQSLTYMITNEIEMLDDNFIEHFKVKDGQHPNLLVMYKRNKIHIETLTVLNNILQFFPIWDKKINDTIIWPNIRDKCLKYHHFLHYDKTKIKKLVKSMVEREREAI